MSIAALRCRLVLPVLATILCASSVAEARHWRYYGYYRRDYERNSEVDRGRDRELRGAIVPRGRATGFGPTVEQLIRGCGQEVVELKNWPFDSLGQTVSLDDKQRDALGQMQGAATASSDTLAAACPNIVPAALNERLAALDQVVDAFIAALDAVRPAIESFYAALDDEQKARLVAMYMSSNNARAGGEQPSRSARGERPPREAAGPRETVGSREATGPQPDATCGQWAAAFRDWPTRQIESGIPLSDAQRAALYDLTAAVYRAIGALLAACPTETSFTPLGQVDTKRKRVDALRQAIRMIRPALDRFAESLDDGQKARLSDLVNANRSNPRRSRGNDDDD